MVELEHVLRIAASRCSSDGLDGVVVVAFSHEIENLALKRKIALASREKQCENLEQKALTVTEIMSDSAILSVDQFRLQVKNCS